MDWLEEELKRALARTAAPAGFEARAVRAARAGTARLGRRWLAAAAVVVLVVAAGSMAGYRQYRGTVAKQQLMKAVNITAVKLNHIQNRVREVRQ